MKKTLREHFLVDEFTRELVIKLIDKAAADGKKINKSDVYRQAVYQTAKESLSDDEITAIVRKIKDSHDI